MRMQTRRRLATCALGIVATGLLSSCTILFPERDPFIADISPSQLRFFTGGDNRLRLHLTLLNRSPEVRAPDIKNSKLLVNGRELPESELLYEAAGGNAFLHGLPPGRRLRIVYLMKTRFKGAGAYDLVWKGEGFESYPVRIIVRTPPKAE
jgi:hypothetical protein